MGKTSSPSPARPSRRAAGKPAAPAGTRRGPSTRIPKDDEEPTQVWLYGLHAVLAALSNPKRQFHRLVATRNGAQHLVDPPLEAQILSPDGMSGMLPPGAVHQGLAVLAEVLPEPDFEASLLPADPTRPVMVLDRVTDPQNVGAVLRSAAGFNARGVVTTRRRSPPLTGTLAKAATGAVEHVPYVRVQNLARALERLREGGYRLIGLTEDGASPLPDIQCDDPVALVLGAEGDGLRPITRNLCDHLAHIPTPGPITALNVSNAAAIALYHVTAKPRSNLEA